MPRRYRMRSRRRPRRRFSRKRKITRRPRHRRTFRKYGTYKKTGQVKLMRLPTITPDRIKTKMVYKYYYPATVNPNSYWSKFFRMNSIYDPDATLGGQHPMGYAEWVQLYQNYRVTYSKIRMKIFNNGVGGPLTMFVQPTNNMLTLPTSDMEDLSMFPRAKTKFAMGSNNRSGTASLSYGCAPYLPQNISRVQWAANTNWESLVGDNPIEQTYWSTAINYPQNLQVGFTVWIWVSITYWVEMWGRQPLVIPATVTGDAGDRLDDEEPNLPLA